MNRQQLNMRSAANCVAKLVRSAVAMPIFFMNAVREYAYCIFYYLFIDFRASASDAA